MPTFKTLKNNNHKTDKQRLLKAQGHANKSVDLETCRFYERAVTTATLSSYCVLATKNGSSVYALQPVTCLYSWSLQCHMFTVFADRIMCVIFRNVLQCILMGRQMILYRLMYKISKNGTFFAETVHAVYSK